MDQMDAIFETLQKANATFAALKKTADRLNNTAQAANELIRGVNARLEEMGVGVAFASNKCALGEDRFSGYNDHTEREEDAGYNSHVLAYAKIHGTWQLGVQTRRYVPGTLNCVGDYDLLRSEDQPLLNADRELRIEAASMLPDFLREYTAHLASLADKLSPPNQD